MELDMGHRKKKIIGDLTREIYFNEPRKEISFDGIRMPLIKHPFPSISADELIKVQPMNEPTSQIFYLDFNSNAWYRKVWKWIRKIFGFKNTIKH